MVVLRRDEREGGVRVRLMRQSEGSSGSRLLSSWWRKEGWVCGGVYITGLVVGEKWKRDTQTQARAALSPWGPLPLMSKMMRRCLMLA